MVDGGFEAGPPWSRWSAFARWSGRSVIVDHPTADRPLVVGVDKSVPTIAGLDVDVVGVTGLENDSGAALDLIAAVPAGTSEARGLPYEYLPLTRRFFRVPRRRALALIAAIVTVPIAAAGVPGSPGQAASVTLGRCRPATSQRGLDSRRRHADDELDVPWMRKTQRLLGEHGVRFSNSFAPLPLCCPARASVLTGQYPHNHGVWGNLSPYGFHALDDRQTLAVWLHRCRLPNRLPRQVSQRYGQQEPYDGDNRPPVVDGSSSSYVPPGWHDWRASLAGTYHYFRTRISDQGQGTTGLSRRYQTRGTATSPAR